jgi:hypothetical protein
MNRKILSILMVLFFLSTLVTPVAATSGDGQTSCVFDDNGTLLPGVQDLGEQELDDASWMNIDLGPVNIVPTGHAYLTPDGKTVFAPSYSTLVAMAANPGASNLIDTIGSVSSLDQTSFNAIFLGSVIGALSGNQDAAAFLQGSTDFSHLSADFKNLFDNYVSGEKLADAMNSGDTFAWSIIGGDVLNIFRQMANNDWNDRQLTTLSLVYSDCASSPTGCPSNYCDLVPDAESCKTANGGDTGIVYINPPSCPVATVTQGAVLLTIKPTAPNFPMVVGQDPDKRGADVLVQAIIQPTVYKYYTSDPVWGQIQVCPNEASSCKKEDMITATVVVRRICTSHTVVYPEQITNVRATANLTQGSKDWISQGLSTSYYGATVKQPSYALIPGMTTAAAGCNGNKVCTATASVSRIQFRDPGYYTLLLSVQTAGTPVSVGRTLNGSGSLSVAFISVRLIDTGN